MGSKLAIGLGAASLLALTLGCVNRQAGLSDGQASQESSLGVILARIAKEDPQALLVAARNLGFTGVSAPHHHGTLVRLTDATVTDAGGNGADDVIWFDLSDQPCFTEDQAWRALGDPWRALAPGAYEYLNDAYQANVYLYPETDCVSRFRIWHRDRS